MAFPQLFYKQFQEGNIQNIVKVGATRGHYPYELTSLRRLTPPVPLDLPEAGAKPIAKVPFGRGKADYNRTALQQVLTNGNIRYRSPRGS